MTVSPTARRRGACDSLGEDAVGQGAVPAGRARALAPDQTAILLPAPPPCLPLCLLLGVSIGVSRAGARHPNGRTPGISPLCIYQVFQ